MAKVTVAEAKRRLKACGWRYEWCQEQMGCRGGEWVRSGKWSARAHAWGERTQLVVRHCPSGADALADLVKRIEAMEAKR